MIKTKADLLEYIQEDMRMQPRPSSFVKRYLGTSGAVVRWKVCLRKCEYHHNISKNIYHRLAYFVYLFGIKDMIDVSLQKSPLMFLVRDY